MKKFLITITSLVLALVVSFSTLVGCGLVTTDTERDMNQVVATVQIDKSAPVEYIYKKDMVTAYLNNNYYSQMLGYGAPSYSDIIDSLIDNRIYVQNAMKTLSEKPEYANVTKKWDVASYLEDDELIDAEYTSIYSLNNIIESYIAHDHSEHQEKEDSLWGETRTTPTGAAKYIAPKTPTEKDTYIKKGLIGLDHADGVDAEERNAYNKVVRALKGNGLLGAKYDGDLRDSDFYNQTLKSAQENILIEKFNNGIKAEVRATFDYAKLSEAYDEKYETQIKWNNETFVDKLSSASAAEPLLYGHGGRYGYVYNLLLGVSGTILETKISEIDVDLKKPEKVEQRRAILDATIVKDLRSSWLLNGYDFDVNTNKFTGDYTFAKDSANSLKFYGQATKIREENIDEGITSKYRVDSVKEFTLNEFIAEMEAYVYGDSTPTEVEVPTSGSIYKKYKTSAVIEEYDAKINELLFAFSTDPGSLNTFKGYAVKPIPEGTDAEEYVQEFADGARALLEMGGTSYIIVATDYGYHVMFFSEVFNADYNFASLEAYLDYEYGDKTEDEWRTLYSTILGAWDEDEEIKEYKNHYLYLLLDSVSKTTVDEALSDYKNKTLNTYKYDSDKYVKNYKDRYADLTE